MSNAGAFSTGGGGGGSVTINGDTGSASGSTISLLATPNSGSSASFSASASTVDLNVTDANQNTIIGLGAGNGTISGSLNCGFGYQALAAVTSGTSNCAFGAGALKSTTTNGNNVAVGQNAMASTTTGFSNIAIGTATLFSLTTGNSNICIGDVLEGFAYTTESHNITIGAAILAVGGDSGVIRIGNFNHTTCYVQGIAGVTVANSAAVLIDTTTGQLGTVASSARYKENIKDLQHESSPIYSLRPVTFNYKKDASKIKQCGLIAEEVLQYMPELVVFKGGEPETVKYHDLPVLLLAEIQKLKAEIELLKKRLA